MDHKRPTRLPVKVHFEDEEEKTLGIHFKNRAYSGDLSISKADEFCLFGLTAQGNN